MRLLRCYLLPLLLFSLGRCLRDCAFPPTPRPLEVLPRAAGSEGAGFRLSLKTDYRVLSPDGMYLACNLVGWPPGHRLSRADRPHWTLVLCDFRRGTWVPLGSFADPVSTPDGRALLSCHWAEWSKDAAACAWDAETGRRLWLWGHDHDMRCIRPFPDSRHFAGVQEVRTSIRAWGELGIWETRTGRLLRMVQRVDLESCYCLGISSDGRLLAAPSPFDPRAGQSITVWDTATWRPVRRLAPFGAWTRVSHVSFCRPGGPLFLAGVTFTGTRWDECIWLWDLHTGRRLCHVVGRRRVPGGVRVEGRAVLCSDGRTLVCGNCRIDLAHPVSPPVVMHPYPDRAVGPWGTDPDLVLYASYPSSTTCRLEVRNVLTNQVLRSWQPPRHWTYEPQSRSLAGLDARGVLRLQRLK